MPTTDRLSALDELFLHLEGPNTHMHVGGLALFEGPAPSWSEALAGIEGRLQSVPRFRQKLATVPYGLGRPVWIDDAHFNLGYHLRHTTLPDPGGETELKRFCARVMSRQLDRSKPLWEMWFVEGLRDGRFAVISKTHHCVVDGVSGADIMSVLMDPGREAPAITPKAWNPAPEPTSDQLIADAIAERLTSPAEIWRSLQSTAVDRRRLPGKIVAGARSLAAFIGGSLDFAPPSSLNQQVGPDRRFETVLADLDAFKRVKRTLGGTVNDVVLTVVAGGLGHLLRARGEVTADLELRAMVPVSVRTRAGESAGNHLAALWALLPVGDEDPVRRFREVSERMKHLKGSGQAVGAQLLTRIGDYTPPTILAQASRVVARQRAYNLVITNVPGPQLPLYLMGRQMQEVYPVLPLSDNTTLGVALLSYNGTLGFGVLGDHDTAPDLGVLAEGVEKSIAELMAAVA
ncbi:MAG: diacylglycerol O-acyltransferase / wax synthase [Actinomycetota bacterium]|jgi:WS/DGAT/MGAT family acyltransferase|nr:diacylglycerol O-acyltransferase / wax synthase [Actinomycetota bacterium]